MDNKKVYRLVVTFPSRRKIAILRITGFGHHSYAPKDFDILCDRKVVKTVRDAQYQSNILTVELPETACKTLELKITGYYGASPAVRELEVYGPEGSKQKQAGEMGVRLAEKQSRMLAGFRLHKSGECRLITY